MRRFRLYLPVLTLLTWALYAQAFGRASVTTVLGLMAMAVSVWVHIREEQRSHGR